MRLKHPVEIAPNLEAGIGIGSSWVTITHYGYNDNRTVYKWTIFGDGFEWSGTDLRSGAGGGGLQSGLESLLSFLSAAAEAVGYEMHSGRPSDNSELFEKEVMDWAYQNKGDIEVARFELEETPNAIEE